MNRKRSRWLAGLLTLMLGISAFPVNPRSAEAAFEGWAVDETQWTYSENGAVITSKGNVIDSIQSAGTVSANKIDFSAAIQRVQSDVDGNIGLYYRCQTGEDYFFEYNSVLNFLRIRKLVNDAAVTDRKSVV